MNFFNKWVLQNALVAYYSCLRPIKTMHLWIVVCKPWPKSTEKQPFFLISTLQGFSLEPKSCFKHNPTLVFSNMFKHSSSKVFPMKGSLICICFLAVWFFLSVFFSYLCSSNCWLAIDGNHLFSYSCIV